jgi:hypothetical protein
VLNTRKDSSIRCPRKDPQARQGQRTENSRPRESTMQKPALPKENKPSSSNELVYFLTSLCLLIVMALLATDRYAFFP